MKGSSRICQEILSFMQKSKDVTYVYAKQVITLNVCTFFALPQGGTASDLIRNTNLTSVLLYLKLRKS